MGNLTDRHPQGFIVAPRGGVGLSLIESGSRGSSVGINSFVLLYIIAMRCRFEEKGDGLKPGQCYISTEMHPFSRQQTRTALSNLLDRGLVTTQATTKGTVATLIDASIFDINVEIATSLATKANRVKQPANNH